jgi:acetyl esterase/lipase
VTGEWVRAARVESAAGAHGAGVVLYLHGSGYFICSPRTHRGLVSRLSAASGLPAFVPAYRKGPEHCYPAAADDIRAAYDWLLAQGFAPDRIVVAGDSAGGHLAITLAADLCREGLPVPAGLVLLSPLVDPTWALAAARDRECRDPFATARGARRLVGLYMRTADLTDPRVAVLRGEPAGLPPMLVQAGGREMLAADAEALAVFVASGGGTCRLQVWPGQVHVFQIFFHLLPEAVAALADAGRFIRDALGAGELAQDAPGAVTRAA